MAERKKRKNTNVQKTHTKDPFKAADLLLNDLSNNLEELITAIDKSSDKQLKQRAKRFLETFKLFLVPFIEVRELISTVNPVEIAQARYKITKVGLKNERHVR